MTRHLFGVFLLLVASCSLRNREGPEVTCDELQGGAVNACKTGIIATCVASTVLYEVCDDENACGATWQSPGRYGCTEADARGFKGVSGVGGKGGGSGSGGTTGKAGNGSGGSTVTFDACGVGFKAEACATCMQGTPCCQKLEDCAGEVQCKSCLGRTGNQTPCAPDLIPAYNAVVECLAVTCTAECKP